MENGGYHPENLNNEELFEELVRVSGIVCLVNHGIRPVASNGHDSERLAILKKIVLGRMIKDKISSEKPIDGKPVCDAIVTKIRTLLAGLRVRMQFKTNSPGSANYFCDKSDSVKTLIEVLGETAISEEERVSITEQIHELRQFDMLLPDLEALENKLKLKMTPAKII